MPDPRHTTDPFFRALCAGQAAAAHALLDPELRASVPVERFEALRKDNEVEVEEVCELLSRTDPALEARARVELDDGETVVLVLEEGRWKLEGGLLEAQALTQPLDTVNELRRALQRRNLSLLLRLLTRERRAAWTAALERSLEGTSDPLDLEVEIEGEEAVVRLTGGGEIHLRREDGQWRIWEVK